MFRRKSKAKRLMSDLNDIVRNAARTTTGKEIRRAFRGYTKQLASVKMPLKVSLIR